MKTNEEKIAESFTKETLKKVESLLSEEYKIGFKEGVEKYLEYFKKQKGLSNILLQNILNNPNGFSKEEIIDHLKNVHEALMEDTIVIADTPIYSDTLTITVEVEKKC